MLLHSVGRLHEPKVLGGRAQVDQLHVFALQCKIIGLVEPSRRAMNPSMLVAMKTDAFIDCLSIIERDSVILSFIERMGLADLSAM